MNKLYPIPADNGKLMFHIYANVLYFLVGCVLGSAVVALDLVGWVTAPVYVVLGFFLSRTIRKLEMKAEQNAGNYRVRDSY